MKRRNRQRKKFDRLSGVVTQQVGAQKRSVPSQRELCRQRAFCPIRRDEAHPIIVPRLIGKGMLDLIACDSVMPIPASGGNVKTALGTNSQSALW